MKPEATKEDLERAEEVVKKWIRAVGGIHTELDKKALRNNIALCLADQRQELAKAVVWPSYYDFCQASRNAIEEQPLRFRKPDEFKSWAYNWLKSNTKTVSVEKLQEYVAAVHFEDELEVARNQALIHGESEIARYIASDLIEARAARLNLKEGL